MSKEQEKEKNTNATEKNENNTTASNETYASKMAQKLIDALTKNFPRAPRNVPGEDDEDSSNNSWFPWGGSNNPGGVV